MTIDVTHCLGDVRIVVPPGMQVQTEGVNILGDTKIDVAPDPAYDGPTVTVRRTTLLGDLKVRSFERGETPPKRWRWF